MWSILEDRRGVFNFGGTGKPRNSGDELHQFTLFVQLIERAVRGSDIQFTAAMWAAFAYLWTEAFYMTCPREAAAARASSRVSFCGLSPQSSIENKSRYWRCWTQPELAFERCTKRALRRVTCMLSWNMTGITVMLAAYTREQTTVAERMTYATVWWIVKRDKYDEAW
jgi:hypothetical protein